MNYGNENDHVVLVRLIPVLYMAHGYGFTFNTGKTFCQFMGGRMTNYTELQTIFNTGYSRCGCGWLDNGRAYAPMTSVIAGCFGAIGIHECTWQSTWDVYCTTD